MTLCSNASARYVLKSIKRNSKACHENVDKVDRLKWVNAFTSQKPSVIALDAQDEVLDGCVLGSAVSDRHCIFKTFN